MDLSQLQVFASLARYTLLQVIVGAMSYLWVRGTIDAERRITQTQRISQLEHRDAARERELDEGMRHVLETTVRVANGDLAARAQLVPGALLFPVYASLNTLLARHRTHRTRKNAALPVYPAARRNVRKLRNGEQVKAADWPTATGLPIDELTVELHDESFARTRNDRAPSGSIPETQVDRTSKLDATGSSDRTVPATHGDQNGQRATPPTGVPGKLHISPGQLQRGQSLARSLMQMQVRRPLHRGKHVVPVDYTPFPLPESYPGAAGSPASMPADTP